MNEKQLQAAEKNMLDWLADPHELGKKPYRMEPAGEFELHDLHYYIFRFKNRNNNIPKFIFAKVRSRH